MVKENQRFRCELCGKTYSESTECCGHPTSDLMSSGCMSCKGCGHH